MKYFTGASLGTVGTGDVYTPCTRNLSTGTPSSRAAGTDGAHSSSLFGAYSVVVGVVTQAGEGGELRRRHSQVPLTFLPNYSYYRPEQWCLQKTLKRNQYDEKPLLIPSAYSLLLRLQLNACSKRKLCAVYSHKSLRSEKKTTCDQRRGT